MTSLLARSPAEGLLPVSIGAMTLAEAPAQKITSIAPWPGGVAPVSTALQAAVGLGFPVPGSTAVAGAARIVWAGMDLAFLIGAEAPDLPDAAVTDQSDGWVSLTLTGPGAEAVLARLVPLDLRPAAFGEGAAAKTLLNHMPLLIWRQAKGFALLTFRSMARTAVAEIAEAMQLVAARGA